MKQYLLQIQVDFREKHSNLHLKMRILKCFIVLSRSWLKFSSSFCCISYEHFNTFEKNYNMFFIQIPFYWINVKFKKSVFRSTWTLRSLFLISNLNIMVKLGNQGHYIKEFAFCMTILIIVSLLRLPIQITLF